MRRIFEFALYNANSSILQ